MKTEIKINEEGIQAEITDRTNADVTLQSNITATADRLTTEVKRLDGDIATAESNMSQTADEIKTEVRKVYAIKEYSGTGQPPSTSSHEYIWKSTSTGKYYIFNEITNRWIETTKNDIKTAFIQTADGFKFDGTVKINGDLITGGTISGVHIDVTTDLNVGKNINLSASRLSEGLHLKSDGKSSITVEDPFGGGIRVTNDFVATGIIYSKTNKPVATCENYNQSISFRVEQNRLAVYNDGSYVGFIQLG